MYFKKYNALLLLKQVNKTIISVSFCIFNGISNVSIRKNYIALNIYLLAKLNDLVSELM